MNPRKKLYKVTAIGDSGTGKTSLCQQLPFNPNQRSTLAAEFFNDEFELPTVIVKMEIWNSGNNKPPFREDAFWRGTDAFILFCDLTNKQSFDNLKNWHRKANDFFVGGKKEPQIYLVATKSDLVDKRQVSPDDLKAFAKEYNVVFLGEHSVIKNKEQVRHNLFKDLAEKLYDKYPLEDSHTTESKMGDST